MVRGGMQLAVVRRAPLLCLWRERTAVSERRGMRGTDLSLWAYFARKSVENMYFFFNDYYLERIKTERNDPDGLIFNIISLLRAVVLL